MLYIIIHILRIDQKSLLGRGGAASLEFTHFRGRSRIFMGEGRSNILVPWGKMAWGKKDSAWKKYGSGGGEGANPPSPPPLDPPVPFCEFKVRPRSCSQLSTEDNCFQVNISTFSAMDHEPLFKHS